MLKLHTYFKKTTAETTTDFDSLEYDYETGEIISGLDDFSDDMDGVETDDIVDYWDFPEPPVAEFTKVKEKKIEEPKENITLNRLFVLWKQLTNSKTLQITGLDVYSTTQFQLTDDKSKHVLTVIQYDCKITLEYSGLSEFFLFSKGSEDKFQDLMKVTKMLFKENALNSLEEDIAGR